MVGFLKALGVGILKGTAIVAGAGPLLKPFTPDVVDRAIDRASALHKIADAVTMAEAMGGAIGADGPQKLKMAAPIVAQIILQSDLIAGKKIANPAEFAAGAADLTSALVRILNAIEGDGQ